MIFEYSQGILGITVYLIDSGQILNLWNEGNIGAFYEFRGVGLGIGYRKDGKNYDYDTKDVLEFHSFTQQGIFRQVTPHCHSVRIFLGIEKSAGAEQDSYRMTYGMHILKGNLG